ncbi:MAG TPA: hypothetical protein VJ255_09440 [Candidatus Acidoferrum sp.]|nr:hypothetical protein [Candidatus Acidoferrum sp.]
MKTFARRLALLALAVPLLFSAAVRAQELTQADKEKALQLLETSKKMVLDATRISLQLSGTSNLLPIAGPWLNAWSTSLPPKTLSVAWSLKK